MLALYDMLLEQKRTALVILNRAIVLTQLKPNIDGPAEIWAIDNIDKLINTQYIFSAVLGELYIQMNDAHNACKYLQQALYLTTSRSREEADSHQTG